MLMRYATVFANNIYAYVFMGVMSLSNGYFSTLAMMFGPSRVNSGEAATAGTLMVCFPTASLKFVFSFRYS